MSLRQLEQMKGARGGSPAFVQNRCFARLGWDRDIRLYCKQQNITYQGFSLLTANIEVVQQPLIAGIAARAKATVAQVLFSFVRMIGILPLTGTSSAEHMKQDLAASWSLALSSEEVHAIDTLIG
jgi:diketogulonate reductase-like aldo/keto reductase